MEMTPPLPSRALAPAQLRRRCDPATLPFTTTAQLMRREGYKLFAMGPEGSD
jgi:hypothetical protein